MTTRTVLLALLLAAPPAAAADPPQGVEFFEAKVRPLLVKHCYTCHSAEAKTLRGELRLDTREGVRKGGTSGPAVVPGDPAKSLLLKAVRSTEEGERMPPKEPLTAAEIADLDAWVKMGAPDPRTGAAAAKALDLAKAREFWSFRPVQDPAVPAVRTRPGRSPRSTGSSWPGWRRRG
jgi:hypothetical protein